MTNRKIIKYLTGVPLNENDFDSDKTLVRYVPLEDRNAEVWARQKGERVPVSYFYRYGNTKRDLTAKSQILVYVDEELVGNVRFRNLKRYADQWAGQTEKGDIVVEVLGKEAKEDWTWWGNSPIRWTADRLIRGDIFGESMKGISYRSRLR